MIGGAPAKAVVQVAPQPLIGVAAPAVQSKTSMRQGTPGAKVLAALGDPDPFVAWSVRLAVGAINSNEDAGLSAALLDEKRRDDALKVCQEKWKPAVVIALHRAAEKTSEPEFRARIIETLAGLYRTYPTWNGEWFGTNPLAGEFPKKTEPWDNAAMVRIQNVLTIALADPDAGVRLRAIAGLIAVGRPALPDLRAALKSESDPKNLASLAQGLGILGDFMAAQPLGEITVDAKQPEAVRSAAVDALGMLRGPQAFNARISLVYDEKAPASLIARALPSLGRDRLIPPNDLASFLDHADPAVRAAGLAAMSARPDIPPQIREVVLAKLDDPSPEVVAGAVQAVAKLKLRESVPKLVELARRDQDQTEATLALAAMPDPRALPVYLAAIRDGGRDVRTAGESALMAIRDEVRPDLEKLALSGKVNGAAAVALERVLTRFQPVDEWKVIGPFPRSIGLVFLGERTIDFAKKPIGMLGKPVGWSDRRADKDTGRLMLEDLKAGSGDRGGFGYDASASPDLAAFAYAEVVSNEERSALIQVGSSGSLVVTVNEEAVLAHRNLAGRPYQPGSELLRVTLKKGTNRILVQSRQGVGAWCFSIQISEPSELATALARRPKSGGPEALRAFALTHEGDPKRGEALFFDAKALDCARCHAINGKGRTDLGPDLTDLIKKYDRTEIIRSVLEPSSRIATGYQPLLLVTRDGAVHSGIVRAENDAFVEVVGGDNKPVRVYKTEITERRAGDVSTMPAGLVDWLSVVEFSDLVSFLAGPRSAAPPR